METSRRRITKVSPRSSTESECGYFSLCSGGRQHATGKKQKVAPKDGQSQKGGKRG